MNTQRLITLTTAFLLFGVFIYSETAFALSDLGSSRVAFAFSNNTKKSFVVTWNIKPNPYGDVAVQTSRPSFVVSPHRTHTLPVVVKWKNQPKKTQEEPFPVLSFTIRDKKGTDLSNQLVVKVLQEVDYTSGIGVSPTHFYHWILPDNPEVSCTPSSKDMPSFDFKKDVEQLIISITVNVT